MKILKKIKKGNVRKYKICGITLFKVKTTDNRKKVYLFGLQIFCKKKTRVSFVQKDLNFIDESFINNLIDKKIAFFLSKSLKNESILFTRYLLSKNTNFNDYYDLIKQKTNEKQNFFALCLGINAGLCLDYLSNNFDCCGSAVDKTINNDVSVDFKFNYISEVPGQYLKFQHNDSVDVMFILNLFNFNTKVDDIGCLLKNAFFVLKEKSLLIIENQISQECYSLDFIKYLLTVSNFKFEVFLNSENNFYKIIAEKK